MTTQGKIRLGVPVVEMGQGIYTSLALCVVEELEMTLDQVEHIETVFHIAFANPILSYFTNDKLRVQMTGGSTSLMGWGSYYQEIGATAREMIISATAYKWNEKPHFLKINGSKVVNQVTGATLSYGELSGKADQISIPQKSKIQKLSDFKVIGKPLKRWETLSKINGTASFGADLDLPEMLYGTIKHPPVTESKIISVDDSKAKSVNGYIASILPEEMTIVVATSTWSAMQGASKVIIHTEGGNVDLSNESIKMQLHEDSKLEGVQAGNKVGNMAEGFA